VSVCNFEKKPQKSEVEIRKLAVSSKASVVKLMFSQGSIIAETSTHCAIISQHCLSIGGPRITPDPQIVVSCVCVQYKRIYVYIYIYIYTNYVFLHSASKWAYFLSNVRVVFLFARRSRWVSQLRLLFFPFIVLPVWQYGRFLRTEITASCLICICECSL
jgi:hypothetical protein